MEQNQNEDVVNFIYACNEFIEGKFILADIKISKILRAISLSPAVYNLIAESLINYDFEREFSRLKGEVSSSSLPHIELPADNQQIIPLVFSMLVEIDSKKTSFNSLLNASFPLANSQKEEYELFSKKIILPFRNAIAQLFNINAKDYVFEENTPETEENILDKKIKEKEKLHPEKETEEENKPNLFDDLWNSLFSKPKKDEDIKVPEEEKQPSKDEKVAKETSAKDDELNLLFSRISRMSDNVSSKVSKVRDTLKRSNILLVVEALKESCKLKNKKIVVALIMSLNLVSRQERMLREELKEINNICYEFYA